ncbi:hypothetical protein [Phycicoccus flavus]|uniref:hypothetical protein n=1 Tax=Phycicoccus flavus TaxID=2502783 RepID=UPI000FEBC151|nr:hypothetical protein [Phycicoccus flavus]NHA70081.1 hypothetical protein [Phycicoccus flavus]
MTLNGAEAGSEIGDDGSPRDGLDAVVARMWVVDDALAYFAFTLTADPLGNPVFSYQSQWVGRGSKRMRELRAASLVRPHSMRHLWAELGQPSVVVTDTETLAVYLCVGGNALIAEDIAKKFLSDLLEPQECVPSPLGTGPRLLSHVPQSALNHAPTQKLRTDVLAERDSAAKAVVAGRPTMSTSRCTSTVGTPDPMWTCGLAAGRSCRR